MDTCEELERATALLRTAVSNFAIGAATLNDYKPIEEKIKDTRKLLKCLTARIQLIRATSGINSVPDVSPENPKELEKELQKKISQHIHNYETLKATVQSLAAENIFRSDIHPTISRKLQAVMNKLYTQNDRIIELQEKIENFYREECNLQREVAASIIQFQCFLKEQEQVRNEKLIESNPEIAKKKERLKKMITKINISKRIITNLIGAASKNLIDKPELLRMLKTHRELVSAETITEITQNRGS